MHSNGMVYYSGTSGGFGITIRNLSDSLTLSLDGYETKVVAVKADAFQYITMKALSSNASKNRQKLISITKDQTQSYKFNLFVSDESYFSLVENEVVNTNKFPNTAFSLNVNKASYSNIRRFLNMQSTVPPDAVRIEELLNYFNLRYKEPEKEEVFRIESQYSDCPWNEENKLLYLNISARKLNLDKVPPSNLVFLIDVSGSMDMTNRLPLLKSAFKMLVSNLRAKDSVAIVVYGGITGIMLNTTSGGEKEKILKTIDELTPGGATPGESGIKLAYSVARNHFIKWGNNRVILATDGDFNVGLRTEDELNELISRHRESGIYLTCLGVGMGNYKDSKIQTLARKGNGNFAYLDNFDEAQKVLMKEFAQTLYAVADDAYMNVEFNPEYVKEYRLIGFDNKVGAIVDSLAMVEGGEIGSGYAMIGVFEIEPAQANLKMDSALSLPGKFADIKLKYRNPNDTTMRYFSFSSTYQFEPFAKIENHYRFSAAVAMFGSLLRTSTYSKAINWNDLALLAGSSANLEDLSQKEFVTIVNQARELYTKTKKKKKQKEP